MRSALSQSNGSQMQVINKYHYMQDTLQHDSCEINTSFQENTQNCIMFHQ